MSDGWIGKSESEIRTELLQRAVAETGLTNISSTGVLRGFVEVLLRTVIDIYDGFITPIQGQTTIETASGDWLSMWGLLVGVSRKRATKAAGAFAAVAADGGAIDEGTWIVAEGTDLRFRVSESITFAAGGIAVPVEAELPGSEYNIIPGTAVRSTRVLPEITAFTVPSGWQSSVGTDDETDVAYRERIKDRWRSLGAGAPPSQYERIAATVPGVVSATVVRTPRGYGSVDVIIVAATGLPSDALLSDVREALDEHALVCRDLLVRAPDAVSVDVELEFTGSPTAEEVEAALRAYILSLRCGDTLEVRRLYVEPWSELVLDTIVISAPTANVVPAVHELVVAGDLTVTKVV